MLFRRIRRRRQRRIVVTASIVLGLMLVARLAMHG